MKKLLCSLIFCLCGAAAFASGKAPVPTVAQIDLQRYMGRWYEIARLPNRFEKDCVGVFADYTLLPEGKVRIVNSCHKKRLDAPMQASEGKAWAADRTNAKLKVRFFWPFYSHYWIMDIGPSYDYAVVGHPSRKYLWILSRKPSMDDKIYSELTEKIKAAGYDLSEFQKTPQWQELEAEPGQAAF